MKSLNLLVFTVFLCMYFLYIPVVLRRWSKNIVKYTVSDMLCCESIANSGVLLRCFFGIYDVLARFWGCEGEKNIVNSLDLFW